MARHRPLGDYAALGDGLSAALVSADGSVDWWCVPRFDSPSVFARLLDTERGGCFAVAARDPAPATTTTIAYEDGTNVARHVVRGPGGAAELRDALAWPVPADAPGSVLVRVLEGKQGTIRCAARFAPRPEYATAPPKLARVPGGVLAEWPGGALALRSPAPLRVEGDEALADVEVRAGERVPFVLTHMARPDQQPVAAERADALLDATARAWRAWDARTSYRGPYRDAVRRSALVLKLLQHEPTGGIVAAPTTSLPEAVGGVRNWDYRYVWVRDAWLLAEALFLTGHPNQARGLLGFLLEACGRSAPALRIMYGLTPGSMPPERELAHLEGWRGSRPVRIGNAAREQFQLDAYGQFLGCLHRCGLAGEDVRRDAWPFLVDMVEVVARRWREPDAGIWEFRAAPRHFVNSKVLAWVALDRAARAARELGMPAPVERWEREREAVRAEVLARGWSESKGAFAQAFGSDALDAANLIMPLVGFLPARDPRMLATVERVRAELADGPLVRRYIADDGLPGAEGAFVVCSFWLVDNLALQGRLDEARAAFEAIVAHAGPLGLLAEEVDPATGEMLGNYPQGFSHIGLLRSALLLDEAARQQTA